MIEGTALPIPRGGHVAGLVDGLAVTAGGNNWSKDRSTKTWLQDCLVFRDGDWKPGPELPHPIAYAMFAHGPHGLYLAGGTDGTVKFNQTYHLAHVDGRSRWQPLAPLPVALSAGGGAIAGDTFYVTCGELEKGMTSRMWSLSLKDPQATWRELPPVPGLARAFPAMACVDGRLYLLGGISSWSPMRVLSDAYQYEPATRTWTLLPELKRPGYAWSAAPGDRQSLILAGRSDGEIHPDIFLVDLPSLEMREIGRSITPTTTAPLIQVKGGEWWLIGGEPDSNKTRTERITVIQSKGKSPG